MSKLWKLGIGTVVEFRGKDRNKVFNNLATQDLRELSAGQAVETFITDPKGRAFGHGLAIGVADALWFVTVPEQASRLVPHFDRFIIMEDAAVADRSGEFTFWLASDDAILLRLGIDLPSSPSPDSFQTNWNNQGVVCARAPWIGSSSRLLLSKSSELPETCDPALRSEMIQSDMTQRTEWESLRIESFWPWYGIDLDEKNLPQEIDRDATAISFRKGCYLGQETIARLDALGQVQKKMVKLSIRSARAIDDLASGHMPLRSGDSEVGQLRSYAVVGPGEAIGLGYVKRSHFAPGTELVLGDKGHTATVLPPVSELPAVS